MFIQKHAVAFTAFCLTALAIPAHAKNVDYAKIYDSCLSKAGGVNNGSVTACAEGTSETAKKEIESLYQKIYQKLKALNPPDANNFEKSQMGWLQYRNKYCALTGSYIGSPMYSYCPMQQNNLRVEELRELHDSIKDN